MSFWFFCHWPTFWLGTFSLVVMGSDQCSGSYYFRFNPKQLTSTLVLQDVHCAQETQSSHVVICAEMNLRPWASFIPTIEVDGRQHSQRRLREHFSAQLCKINQVINQIKPKQIKIKQEILVLSVLSAALWYLIHFQGEIKPKHCKSL